MREQPQETSSQFVVPLYSVIYLARHETVPCIIRLHDLRVLTFMSMPTINALIDLPMQLGESPVWSPVERALYWIDIPGKAVHRFSLAHSEHRTWPVPSEPGCIACCSSGGVIVAMRSGVAILDTNTGALTPVAKSPYNPEKFRFNDGRCDAHGRLWTGTLYDARDEPAGTLYCIEKGRIEDTKKAVTVSNGVAFSPDNKTMYHADTTAHRIYAYDFQADSGTISNPRVFIQFSSDRTVDYGGRPDGAAVDSEGAYWCAMYEGGRLLRISPSGVILDEIALPVRCPTMPAFGGADMKTLFVTTARNNRSADELKAHPLSGCVLAFHVDVAGQADHAYSI
jgi:sugar lactone lactonase YvrE